MMWKKNKSSWFISNVNKVLQILTSNKGVCHVCFCLQKLMCFQVDVFKKGYKTWIYFVILLQCVNSLFLKCLMAEVSHYFHNCVLCMQLMWLIIWEEVIYISIIGYTWHHMVNQKDKEAMFGCRAMKKIV